MIVLIRAAKVVDPNSKYNNEVVDILVVKGIIQKIGKNLKIPKGAEIIEENGLHVSPGFFDLRVNFGDPGFEWKEDMQTGMYCCS